MTRVPRIAGLALLCTLAACGGGGGGGGSGTGGLPSETAEAIRTYGRIVEGTYEDALTAAEALDASVQAFTAAPGAERLAQARDAWRAAREPYLQTEAFRFYDGPIDDPDGGPEGLLNAWPLDEAYIDYVAGNPDAGIVNDPAISIDAASLAALNEQGGEENVATGYHAVEFLLWGQDFSADGPGDRPYTDYVAGEGGTAEYADRRALYLETVSGMIAGHLRGVLDAWRPGAANYRRAFEAAEPADALARILTGLIVLSGFETGGERLQTALDSGSQEDEHSCFSDNTHRDMIQDVQGVRNVWRGAYLRLDGSTVSGVGIREVVRARDAALAAALDDRIAESLRLANAIVPPFDQEIASGNVEGRARVQALVDSLREQERLLEEAFVKLGLSIPTA